MSEKKLAKFHAFTPQDVGEDEYIALRLGWSILRHWGDLPDDMKRLIKTQTRFVLDSHQADVQVQQKIDAFIEEHKGVRDSSAGGEP